jgi:lipopolysaccharide biosynthesis glycosyltransferase
VSVLHLGCAVEGDYVPHSAAMLHSLIGQSGSLEVRVHYLHGPELPEDARRLGEMVEAMGAQISFVAVPDELVAGVPTEGFTRKATWYRTLVPELLPDVERILFLDADLLALQPLAPLWETDISDHYVAAVTNVFQADWLFRPAELGIDPRAYFNAGVLLMNLDLMRRDGCSVAMREYALTQSGNVMLRDQDVLNVVLGGRRLPLHPRWNCMNAMLFFPWSVYVFGAEAVEEAREHPAIRHFEGPSINKPWIWGSWAPQREAYFEHRRHTPWPEVQIEEVPSLPRRLGKLLRRRLRS